MNCLTINDFAVQAEMVAVESSIDMGNILWIFYDCLSCSARLSEGEKMFVIRHIIEFTHSMRYSTEAQSV